MQLRPATKSKRSLGIGSDAEILFDETKILVLLNLHVHVKNLVIFVL